MKSSRGVLKMPWVPPTEKWHVTKYGVLKVPWAPPTSKWSPKLFFLLEKINQKQSSRTGYAWEGGSNRLKYAALRHGGPSINMEHMYETMSESRKRRGCRHLMWPSKKSFTCAHVSNSDGDSWWFSFVLNIHVYYIYVHYSCCIDVSDHIYIYTH